MRTSSAPPPTCRRSRPRHGTASTCACSCPVPATFPWSRPFHVPVYRPLLEAGVRVFEWNGTMLHAKTAVADGVWARVGSTNLNLASWMGNYELDVAIEDAAFAEQMAAQYENDLQHATEVVLTRRNRVRRSGRGVHPHDVRRALSGSAGRAAAGAVSVGSTLGAALTNRRTLGAAEAGLVAQIGLVVAGAGGHRGTVAESRRLAAGRAGRLDRPGHAGPRMGVAASASPRTRRGFASTRAPGPVGRGATAARRRTLATRRIDLL